MFRGAPAAGRVLRDPACRRSSAPCSVPASRPASAIRGCNIGGMNHFMLPLDASQGESAWGAAVSAATRYGNVAMERLINDILKLGGRRQDLEIKLVGGGRVLSEMTNDVGARNIDFVREYVRDEGFRVAERRSRRRVRAPRGVFPAERPACACASSPPGRDETLVAQERRTSTARQHRQPKARSSCSSHGSTRKRGHANRSWASAPALAEFTRQIARGARGRLPELPSFPESRLRVRQALSRDDVAIDEVVRIVSAEPSLSVRLLQLANSAALNPGCAARDHAARGHRAHRLQPGAQRHRSPSPCRRCGAPKPGAVCRHSFARSGKAARGLPPPATRWRASWRRADADQALLAGMLHVRGQVVRADAHQPLSGAAERCGDRRRDRKRLAGARGARVAHALGAAAPRSSRPPASFDQCARARGRRRRHARATSCWRAATWSGCPTPAELAGSGLPEAPRVSLRLGLDAAGAAEVLARLGGGNRLAAGRACRLSFTYAAAGGRKLPQCAGSQSSAVR